MGGSGRLIFRLAFVAVTVACGGCGFLPASGPYDVSIRAGQLDPNSIDYALVKITPEVVDVLARWGPRGIAGAFRDRRPPPEIKFGIGDVVSVTIFEAAAGGLFIPIEAGVRPGNFVSLPNQSVDTSGNISVPYAGAVRAAGRTPSQIQQDVVEKIRSRAIDPQVIVALINQNTSLISVLGEVNTPSRFPALPAGEHILDAITRAGGIKGQGFETWVVLERQGRRATVPFGALIYAPENNIWVWPADTLYLYREPQVFLAFGAQAQQGQFPFQKWRISLAEAVADAGGLLDLVADPGSVFLYRREPRELAEKLGVNTSRFQGPTIPVIYNISFRDPGGYFLATRVQMQHYDVVYAANASSVEVTKFTNYIRTLNATANEGLATAISTQTLRILSH